MIYIDYNVEMTWDLITIHWYEDSSDW